MDINTATEYAFKNGYKQALQDAMKFGLIFVEHANKLLALHNIDPFSN